MSRPLATVLTGTNEVAERLKACAAREPVVDDRAKLLIEEMRTRFTAELALRQAQHWDDATEASKIIRISAQTLLSRHLAIPVAREARTLVEAADAEIARNRRRERVYSPVTDPTPEP